MPGWRGRERLGRSRAGSFVPREGPHGFRRLRLGGAVRESGQGPRGAQVGLDFGGIVGLTSVLCAAPEGAAMEWGRTPPLFLFSRFMSDRSLEEALEERTEALGFELVELERTGSKNRPVLRVRVDRPGSTPGQGVGLDDCARISRSLEEYLDALDTLPGNYVLEVSSPGVERPLVRRRDYERFAGQEVVVKGYAPLAGRGKRLQGELLGVVDGPDGELVRLRLEDTAEVEVARKDIARAHLVFRWNE